MHIFTLCAGASLLLARDGACRFAGLCLLFGFVAASPLGPVAAVPCFIVLALLAVFCGYRRFREYWLYVEATPNAPDS
jgi:hypothetical protein